MTLAGILKEAVQANVDRRFQVKLYRSVVGLSAKTREAAKALGFRRTNQTVYVHVNPYTVGNLVKIKELVKVQLIDVSQVPPKNYLKTPCGYKVIGNLRSCTI